jgi:hypothetical protein
VAQTRSAGMSAIPPLLGDKRTSRGEPISVAIDPDVWSGRALQVDFAELAVSGLASMYPVSNWSCLLRTIMDISARAISLTDRPQRAIWVTSVRTRSEDRTSISSHPLADLGWKLLIGLRHRSLLISAVPLFEPMAVPSSRPAER